MNIAKLLAALLAGLVLFSGTRGYAEDTLPQSYPPLQEALEALESDCKVTVNKVDVAEWEEGSNFYYIFTPTCKKPTIGFIFYPGALVDPRSYAPPMHSLAGEGYLTVIVKMVGDLAILSSDRATTVINDHPEIETWIIGGHSLGGAMACSYARDYTENVKGVVLWASYPSATFSIRDKNLKVISIYGTKDGLATLDEIEASKADLPPDTQFVPIEGGNHTQFGWYDTSPDPVQPDDNPADISREKQQCCIIHYTEEFLDQFKCRCAATYLLGKDNPRLEILRQFRDTVLVQSATGKSLIACYYKYSAALISLFKQHTTIKYSARQLVGVFIAAAEYLRAL